jgi:hypothetical protein
VRTDVLLGGGVAWTFADPWTLEVGVLGRVAKLTDANTLDYPGVVQLGLSTRFDLAGGEGRGGHSEEEEEGHGH